MRASLQTPWRRLVGGAEDCGQTFDQELSGTTNDGDRHQTAGLRPIYAYDYVGAISGSLYIHAYARFTSVTVPAGATIENDTYYEPYVDVDNSGGALKSNIYMVDEDNPAAPTTTAEFDADPLTSAFVAWDDTAYNLDVYNQSPSIREVVQEIVDRGGWASGQAMMIQWRNDGSGDNVNVAQQDVSRPGQSEHAKLHIQYCA